MSAVRFVAASCLLIVAFAAAGQNVSRMSIHVASGVKAGEQVVTVGDDGWIRAGMLADLILPADIHRNIGVRPFVEEKIAIAAR